MFLGHVALGFAAKRAAPTTSLAVLVLAAQLADTVWPVLVALGLEQVAVEPGNTRVTPLSFISYPYSHPLLTMALWAIAFGYAFGMSRGQRTVSILAALVVSHWLLDVVTHRPDMPVVPTGPKFGLGLWNSIAGTMLVELPMYVLGVWMYLSTTRPRDRIGTWAFGSLAAFLIVVYLANIFGPPPPSADAVWAGALVGAVVLTLWAGWADHHRVSRPSAIH
jgi:hypothetical protein